MLHGTTDGFQMPIERPTSEGKCAIKRQVYSEPFNLREAASFINILSRILHTAALKTDPDSCPPEVKQYTPYENHLEMYLNYLLQPSLPWTTIYGI